MDVGMTILKQLGGNRFAAMTGAKNFVASQNSLSFRIGRNAKSVSAVHIELTPADTYTVKFLRIKKHETTLIKSYEDIYADQLQSVFREETGLETHL